MINISRLRKLNAIVAGMTFSLLTNIACSSDPDNSVIVEKENSTVEPEKASVLNKMTAKEQIDFSKQDLAARLGLDIDAIKVSGATPVNWRSGALGCPEPGMVYADVLVPGIWLILRVDNATYRYHAIPNGQPFFCPNDRAEPPVTGSGAD